MQLTGNDVTDIVKNALQDALSGATLEDRQAYLDWSEQMAPMVTQFTLLAAQGDPLAPQMLSHIRAQAEAKAWSAAIAVEAKAAGGFGDIAVTAATVAGSFLTSLVAKYGLVLLGLGV